MYFLHYFTHHIVIYVFIFVNSAFCALRKNPLSMEDNARLDKIFAQNTSCKKIVSRFSE